MSPRGRRADGAMARTAWSAGLRPAQRPAGPRRRRPQSPGWLPSRHVPPTDEMADSRRRRGFLPVGLDTTAPRAAGGSLASAFTERRYVAPTVTNGVCHSPVRIPPNAEIPAGTAPPRNGESFPPPAFGGLCRPEAGVPSRPRASTQSAIRSSARLWRAVPAGGRPSSPGGGSKPSPPSCCGESSPSCDGEYEKCGLRRNVRSSCRQPAARTEPLPALYLFSPPGAGRATRRSGSRCPRTTTPYHGSRNPYRFRSAWRLSIQREPSRTRLPNRKLFAPDGE